jgi:hypothetical protein
MLLLLLSAALDHWDGLGEGVVTAVRIVLGIGFLLSILILWFLIAFVKSYFPRAKEIIKAHSHESQNLR